MSFNQAQYWADIARWYAITTVAWFRVPEALTYAAWAARHAEAP